MFGLRQKLMLGFGGLLAILLLVSALGVWVLSQYQGELDRFFKENVRSVEYGRRYGVPIHVRSSFSTKPGGSGIGLALARQIVVGHGGWITAEDVDGGGSRFVVVLPLGGADNVAGANRPRGG